MDKKGDMPGWAYVVGLVIGLLIIGLIVYISIKSRNDLGGILSWLG